MATLLLPRTAGCLVCGRENPRGLDLQMSVDDASGTVTAAIVARSHHAGFNDVVHGGLIATVADEVMAWAAAWASGRFGLCGELTIRFRRPAIVGATLRFAASVEGRRSRLVTTIVRCVNDDGAELATGSAKYVPMAAGDHARVVATFLDEPTTRDAARRLTNGHS